jgi:hypothetical protein
MSRPRLPEDFEVFVDSIDEQGRATYLSGYFEFNKSRFKFDAIAMEGYGGPNIAASLDDQTMLSLRRMELDETEIDDLITTLQRKIMEGAAHIQLRKTESEDPGAGTKPK